MSNLCRLRRFLGLTQLEVSLASGIPVDRISKAERELVLLTNTENQLITRYLEARYRIAANDLNPNPKTQVLRFDMCGVNA